MPEMENVSGSGSGSGSGDGGGGGGIGVGAGAGAGAGGGGGGGGSGVGVGEGDGAGAGGGGGGVGSFVSHHENGVNISKNGWLENTQHKAPPNFLLSSTFPCPLAQWVRSGRSNRSTACPVVGTPVHTKSAASTSGTKKSFVFRIKYFYVLY